MSKKDCGIWFFGLAGSGKTFASSIIKPRVSDPFVIDGDEVRRLISFDLGYAEEDRKIQLQRVIGLAEIAIMNHKYPIISTVTMNASILDQSDVLGLRVINIVRSREQVIAARLGLYRDEKNVVGKDIPQESIKTEKIKNDGSANFEKLVLNYVK